MAPVSISSPIFAAMSLPIPGRSRVVAGERSARRAPQCADRLRRIAIRADLERVVPLISRRSPISARTRAMARFSTEGGFKPRCVGPNDNRSATNTAGVRRLIEARCVAQVHAPGPPPGRCARARTRVCTRRQIITIVGEPGGGSYNQLMSSREVRRHIGQLALPGFAGHDLPPSCGRWRASSTSAASSCSRATSRSRSRWPSSPARRRRWPRSCRSG